MYYLLRYCVNNTTDSMNLNINAYTSYDGNSAIIEIITYKNVVDPAQRNKVFEWRSDVAKPGEGLSLPFIKTLTERNGGNIRIEDRVPGQPEEGTKFVIRLPMTPLTNTIADMKPAVEKAV